MYKEEQFSNVPCIAPGITHKTLCVLAGNGIEPGKHELTTWHATIQLTGSLFPLWRLYSLQYVLQQSLRIYEHGHRAVLY